MRILVIKGFVCGLLLLVLGCGGSETEQSGQGTPPSGASVFPPELYAWKDHLGQNVDLRDYQGKIVLLNFWATWCGPCRYEIPDLVKIRGDYDSEQVVIIGVSLDRGAEEQVRPMLGKFVERFEINYPVLHDGQFELIRIYYKKNLASVAVPMTFVFDQQGQIYRTHVGVPRDKNGRPNPRSVLSEDIRSLLARS